VRESDKRVGREKGSDKLLGGAISGLKREMPDWIDPSGPTPEELPL